MPGENLNAQNQSPNSTASEWDTLTEEVPFQPEQHTPSRFHFSEVAQFNTDDPETCQDVLNSVRKMLQGQHERGSLDDKKYQDSIDSLQDTFDFVSENNVGAGLIDAASTNATQEAHNNLNKFVVAETMKSYIHPEMQLAKGIINYSILQIADMQKDFKGQPAFADDQIRMNELEAYSDAAKQYIKWQEGSGRIDAPNQTFADFLQDRAGNLQDNAKHANQYLSELQSIQQEVRELTGE